MQRDRTYATGREISGRLAGNSGCQYRDDNTKLSMERHGGGEKTKAVA